MKRRDIKGYMTDDFYELYTCWRRFDLGLGLPFGGSWQDYPERFISVMETFIGEWRLINDGN